MSVMRVRIGGRHGIARAFAWLRGAFGRKAIAVCARCGCPCSEGYGGTSLPSGTIVCRGIMPAFTDGGEPWCLHLQVCLR